jgi:hypothetical protein
MSFATLNGRPILTGRITLPRSGVWVANLTLDGPDAASSGQVAVQVGKQLTLSGTIVRSGTFAGKATMLVVGGKGKLRTPLPGKDHLGAPLSVVLGDLCTEAGETLSPTCDADVLALVATPSWVRAGGPAADALGRVLADAGSDIVWRVRPDGSVWVGRETWPASKGMADVVVLEHDHGDGRIVLVTEAPELLPGMTFRGDRVSSVEIAIEPSKIRLEALVETKGAARYDRFKAALASIIETVIGPRIDYLAPYVATVVTQHDSGQLDVTCDDKRVGHNGSLSNVPIRLGLPGASVKVTGGTVIVQFANGNPKAPIATLWGDSDVSELAISGTKIKIGGGGLPACRQGDMVMMFGGGLPNAIITLIPITPGALGAGQYSAIVSNVVDPTGVLPVFGTTASGNPAVEE